MRGRQGFTLTEIIIALGISSLAVLAMTAIWRLSAQSQNTARTSGSFNEMRSQVLLYLQNPAECRSRLELGPAGMDPTGKTNLSIYKGVGRTADEFIVGATSTPIGGLKYEVYLARLKLQSTSGANRNFIGDLVLEGKRIDDPESDTEPRLYLGAHRLKAEIPISLTLNAANQLLACSVQPRMDMSSITLFGGIHTAQDCLDQNGVIWPADGTFICRVPNMDPKVLPSVVEVNGAAVLPRQSNVRTGFPPVELCPSGWQIYKNYHKSRNTRYCDQTCHSGSGCRVVPGNGGFSDTPTMKERYTRKSGSMPYCNSWQEDGFALIEAAGCY